MDQKFPSPSTSPNSSTSSSSTNGGGGGRGAGAAAAAAALPPLTPKSIPNLNPNPNPTTFIQADTKSFKQVVQMLTGSADTTSKRSASASSAAQNCNSPFAPPPPPPLKNHIPPICKKPAFKLYERRSSMKNLKMISPLIPNSAIFRASSATAFSPRSNQPEIFSPSVLDFPSLVLSPVTPLSPDPFNRSPHASAISAEDRAIAEKGFFLHPSPRTTPRDAQPPKLLPLFPLTSPRIQSSAAAAAAAE